MKDSCVLSLIGTCELVLLKMYVIHLGMKYTAFTVTMALLRAQAQNSLFGNVGCFLVFARLKCKRLTKA